MSFALQVAIGRSIDRTIACDGFAQLGIDVGGEEDAHGHQTEKNEAKHDSIT